MTALITLNQASAVIIAQDDFNSCTDGAFTGLGSANENTSRTFFLGKNNGTGGLYTTDATNASVESSSTDIAR